VNQIWKLNLKAMTNDGDAECLFCNRLFLHDKYDKKWNQCVRCYQWAHDDCGVEEDYFVCPMGRKSVKLVT